MSANSDPNIKNIQLVGGLSMEDGKTRKSGKKASAKTFKIDRSGGGSTSPGTLTQLTASRVPGSSNIPEPVGVDSPLTSIGAPLQIAGKKTVTSTPSTTSTPASTPVKVVLGEAKKKGRVVLAAAKPALKTPIKPGKTRKVSQSKKIRVTISSLSRKIHKAKAIRKTATESTLEEIKKVLNKAGLIKADSKAPETMLRQMYADYMTLKGRAL